MITINNYNSKAESIDFSKLPDAIQETHKNFADFIDYYGEDKDITEMLDTYISRLNVAAAKQMTKKPAKAKNETAKATAKKDKPVTKAKTTAKPKTDKKVKVKPKEKRLYRAGKKLYFDYNNWIIIGKANLQPNGMYSYDINSTEKDFGKSITQEHIKKLIGASELFEKRPRPDAKAEKVERVPLEVSYIKRFVLLHGKQKNKMQILSFLASLQKAMIEKRIRKTSRYANEILYIQDKLIELAKMFNSKTQIIEIIINENRLLKLKNIAYSKVQMPNVRFIKRIIGMQGKKIEKEKVNKIIEQLQKAVNKHIIKYDDKYSKLVDDLFGRLKAYVDGKTSTVSVSPQTLNGLMGIVEKKKIIKPTKFKKGEVVSSNALAGAYFELMGFKDKWLKLIGDPEIPFKCMLFGRAGKGKTSFAVMLSKYLSADHNKKVLFVAHEEGLSYKLQEKLKRFQAFHPNLDVVDTLPVDLSKYDIVIIDSGTSLKMKPDEFEELSKKYKKTSFIVILQAIKAGDFKGDNEWEHVVDVKIRFENGIATTLKSRFGGSGEMKVY